jgi:hypothetical protein
MKTILTASAFLLALPAAHAADYPFDGTWSTVLSCPNSTGALGFAFHFDSHVASGVLHGQKGTKGEPGWLTIDGPIDNDGSADLLVSGIVGAAPFAVGQRPAGTSYSYHVDAKFTRSSGNGHRVEGRPCTAEFTKQ